MQAWNSPALPRQHHHIQYQCFLPASTHLHISQSCHWEHGPFLELSPLIGLVQALSPLPFSTTLIGQNSFQLTCMTDTHLQYMSLLWPCDNSQPQWTPITRSAIPIIYVRLLRQKPINAFSTHTCDYTQLMFWWAFWLVCSCQLLIICLSHNRLTTDKCTTFLHNVRTNPKNNHHVNNTCRENWHGAAVQNEPTLELHRTLCLVLSPDISCYSVSVCNTLRTLTMLGAHTFNLQDMNEFVLWRRGWRCRIKEQSKML